jgi:hypothetical protein
MGEHGYHPNVREQHHERSQCRYDRGHDQRSDRGLRSRLLGSDHCPHYIRGGRRAWLQQYLFTNISYATYLLDLTADAKTSDDATALAHLPTAAQFSTFFGTSNISIKTANERAIGIANGQNPDGTITLNTSIMNLSRTGSQDPTKYDLMAVASHEIDEVLGLGSALPTPPSGNPFPEDLFRYDNSGGRSYTATSGAAANFSIDGTTILAPFHNTSDGADYGDWLNSSTIRVQDAVGTPGAQPNLGVELRALDVIGYDRIAAIPEPGTGVLLAAALVVLVGLNYARVSRKARLPRELEG